MAGFKAWIKMNRLTNIYRSVNKIHLKHFHLIAALKKAGSN